MRSQDLYPELTPGEVDEVIAPLIVDDDPRSSRSDDDPRSSRSAIGGGPPTLAVSGTLVELEAFGADVERHSFATVCDRVAGVVLDAAWPRLRTDAVGDLDAVRGRVHEVLSADTGELLVRSLADALVPVPERDPRLVYREYCRDLVADGLRRHAHANPVAWDRLARRTTARLSALEELFERLAVDHADLVAELGVGPSAKVVDVDVAGDTHAGGRTVSVVRFDDGSAVVYKPRPIDGEAGWEYLVGELRDRLGVDLRAARTVRRVGYGWVEHLVADSGLHPDLSAVGRLAAVLYAVNARDMHTSNILTTASGPVPVDLETMLHPARERSAGISETEHSGYHRLAISVFGTGVLPMLLLREDRDGYLDIGYLGGGDIRGSGPFRRLHVEHPFDARMRVGWAPEAAAEPEPPDVPDDVAHSVRRDCAQMVVGFTEAYTAILAGRAEFTAAVRRAFAGAELRYIHNATVQYAQCLRILTGPSASRDYALATGLVKRIGIASRGADPHLVSSECTQLWQTDIPYFLVRADSTTVTDGSVARRPVAELDRSPLAQCVAKIEALSADDLAMQVRLIRLAFTAKLADPHTVAPAEQVLRHPVAGGVDAEDELRSVAREVADALVAEMVEDRYPHLPATWIGPVATAHADRPWPPGVLGYDLYTGRVGPALALAALSRGLARPDLAAASTRVFGPSADILDARSHEARSLARAGCGAYAGFPGALWAMWHSGRVLARPELTATAVAALDLLAPSAPGGPVAGDGWFDLVTGDVGAVHVGLALRGPEAAEAAVEACGFALRTGLLDRMQHSGLAHGLAGLLLLAAHTHRNAGDNTSAALAASVVRRLDVAFGWSEGTPRPSLTGPRNESDSWCNGSAGLLVATAAAVRAGLAEPSRVTDLVVRIGHSPISTATTLCHGALGLYESLGVAAAVAPDETSELRARLGGYLDADRLRASLASSDSRYSQAPCLMVGRAGVAWHLASRLGVSLPSPLDLAAPVADA
ncbi:MAG: type 2 lanthipeptide synthetase LanM [Dermatophilaceae bacterium]